MTDVQERIIRAAADLLTTGGRQAVSTRAVSAAAGVQPPTIYRQFGDMQGLLDAVARHIFGEYTRQKVAHTQIDDPIEELRHGWDRHVAFGLENPAVYTLICSDPDAVIAESTWRDAYAVLHELVERVAQAGRLRVSVPHAARLIAAAGEGVTLSLIATPPKERDLKLSTAMREAVITAITIPTASDAPLEETPGPERVVMRAVALHAVLAEAPNVLSMAEQQLLGEWLDRLANVQA
ncbi:MAG: TetR/AcrR family transcriptional regulator [Chloroflexi bacterium]|nr:TetR/AcrR family transcriptional regulator [Chloroflexota bacterium]